MTTPITPDRFTLHRFDVSAARHDSVLRKWTVETSLVFAIVTKDGTFIKYVRYEREYDVQYPDDHGVWRIAVRLKGYPTDVR